MQPSRSSWRRCAVIQTKHRCCRTPASSLTWGSEDGLCPPVSGSKAAAASSAPLEREQQAFAPKRCITRSPLSTFFCSLFPPLCLPGSPQWLTPPRSLPAVLMLPWSFSFWLRASAVVEKAQSASEDLDWKGRVELVSRSLHLRVFLERLAGTLGYVREVCRQTALTSLQQMPTAARAAGHCQYARRPWMPPNEKLSPSCTPLEAPRQLGWFFCVMAAAQPGSEATR